MKYDVIIIGAGPGGIFSAYELVQQNPDLKIAVFESGHPLEKRHCPIDGDKIKSCINCKSCSIMSGFGGAGAFSDGKYNITNAFGGTLYEYIGKSQAIDLMKYVDDINMKFGGEGTKLYSTAGTSFKKICMQNKLNLLDASVRHLGTDINFIVLENLYAELKDKVTFYFDTPVKTVKTVGDGYRICCENASYDCDKCIISVGRSGSKWMEQICKDLDINTKSNRVDIGVRVESPAEIYEPITDICYESKLIYYSRSFDDRVRTFCMNPYGFVVTENNDGLQTVNGHSYAHKRSGNTNFAVLVSKQFTEPFREPIAYGKYIAALANMLGGGPIVQRLGDLRDGRRSTAERIRRGLVRPTMPSATPGDLSLVLPYRFLKDIMEMFEALDRVAPGANSRHTLLYGVEVKFYSSRMELSPELETKIPNLFAIGDGAGITRGLAQASAAGVIVGREICAREGKPKGDIV